MAGQLRSTDFDRAPLTVGIATALCNKSPLHAAQASGWWRNRLGIEAREDSDSMAFGRMAHDACLFGLDRFVAFDADRRTKAGKEAYAAALEEAQGGKVLVKPYELDRLQRIVDAFRAALPWSFLPGDCEQDLVWTEQDDFGRDVQCLGRADILLAHREQPIIIDLKTCADANPERGASKHIEYGYDIQMWAYTSALKHLGVEDAQFWFLNVETERPFATSLVTYDALMRKHGELRWEYAKRKWTTISGFGEKIGKDAFEGYGKRVISAPKWALDRVMTLDEKETDNDNY